MAKALGPRIPVAIRAPLEIATVGPVTTAARMPVVAPMAVRLLAEQVRAVAMVSFGVIYCRCTPDSRPEYGAFCHRSPELCRRQRGPSERVYRQAGTRPRKYFTYVSCLLLQLCKLQLYSAMSSCKVPPRTRLQGVFEQEALHHKRRSTPALEVTHNVLKVVLLFLVELQWSLTK